MKTDLLIPVFLLNSPPKFHLPEHDEPTYLQQLWSLNECYDFVRDHEKRFKIRYQLMIRARVDILAKMPLTFERSGKYNVNTTINVPPNRNFLGIDDGFALGPIELMSHYMKTMEQSSTMFVWWQYSSRNLS